MSLFSALAAGERPQLAINEVMTRDGLQSEALFVPTEAKIALVDQLSRTGLAKIEVTSFVSPRAIPNLRDAAEVMAEIIRHPGVTYVALVPNVRGAERALECSVDEINLVMSIGEEHNLANMRMTCAQSLAQFADVMSLLQGSPMKVNGTLATAFGCPFGGGQSDERVRWAIDAYLELGMHSITLADTTGMAFPRQVYERVAAVRSAYPQLPLTLHFHNTRGMGLANVLAAVEAGARSFDASLGGIGGCPYAPGASGNISTEDTVHMLEGCGIATGVDLDALLAIGRELPILLGHDLPGQILKAGKSSELRQRGSVKAQS
ncbi:hydroxymethylglutaryl-CoA lyase [Pokkaliibacter plantistimulans]|uniref:Hydroxymethylglutaryl-CoA lyase n=1 Tax=Proteobacteria bacterium 228 TaxID=2083153 RepID=A0A2S5KND7_9PROT|nr:hydroxymethylglutaryl-CoA lyase [Pokkaliibacter plantistimulans]PPC76232.1 hydroxymethylglutaryl-CoA lyase [Pokkaliibacter plantistimulans]